MKKDIVVFTRSLPFHGIGGMEIMIWDLITKFHELGCLVSVITTDIPHKPEVFVEKGIKVINIKNVQSGKYSNEWFRRSAQIYKNIFLNKNNIVLSVSAGAKGLIDKNIKVPIIFQAHGTSLGEIKSKLRTLKIKPILSSIKNLIWFFKDLKIYKKVNSIVAVGDKVYEDLVHMPYKIFLNEKKVFLIRNGINTDIFKPDLKKRQEIRNRYNFTDKTKIFISVSRLHRQKGVYLSLKAFAEYHRQKQDSFYFIIGDGEEKANLMNLAKKLQIEKKVTFLGSMRREEIVDYLNASDIFLFNTLRNEGLPLNVLESLAVGLRVIISSHINEVININADVIKGANPKKISEIVKKINEFSRYEREYVSYLPEEYTLDYCAKKYIELMERI